MLVYILLPRRAFIISDENRVALLQQILAIPQGLPSLGFKSHIRNLVKLCCIQGGREGPLPPELTIYKYFG